MPIDISREDILSMTQATRCVPPLRGRQVAVSTLFRWSTAGLNGVRLETIQIGGTRCTSVQALQRFFDRLSGEGATEQAAPDRQAACRQGPGLPPARQTTPA
jgi:hypothetical protein